MEHQKTSYDTLPERIDYLIQEISEIKKHSDKQNRKKGRNPQIFKYGKCTGLFKKRQVFQ